MLIAQLYLHQLHLLVGVAVVDVGDGVPAPLTPQVCGVGCVLSLLFLPPQLAGVLAPWLHGVIGVGGVLGLPHSLVCADWCDGGGLGSALLPPEVGCVLVPLLPSPLLSIFCK